MMAKVLVFAIAAMPLWMVIIGFALHALNGYPHVDDAPTEDEGGSK